MGYQEEQKRLKDLRTEQTSLSARLAIAERRIQELAPKHAAHPYFKIVHPDDSRDMEQLQMWKHNIERGLRDLARDIEIAESNLSDLSLDF